MKVTVSDTKDSRKGGSGLKLLLILLSLLLIPCLSYIGYLAYGYFTADQEYDEIKEQHVAISDNIVSEEPEEAPYVSPIPYMDIDIDGLIAANPDFVCWLYYKEGNIDYPVVKEHEDDINAYLHKTFEGKSNSAGCIFIPYDASEGFHDLNTFFYGHNMKNGSMFGSLKKIFRNPKENLTDPYFYIWTKDHKQIMYRVISMYVVNKNSAMFAVPTEFTTYKEYLEDVLNNGSIEGFVPFTDTEEQAMDDASPLATFSVCYGKAGTSNRLLVHGVKILEEDYVR